VAFIKYNILPIKEELCFNIPSRNIGREPKGNVNIYINKRKKLKGYEFYRKGREEGAKQRRK